VPENPNTLPQSWKKDAVDEGKIPRGNPSIEGVEGSAEVTRERKSTLVSLSNDSPAPARTDRPLGPGGWLAPVCVIGLVVIALRLEGHRWWCRCGRINPWSGDIWSEHNSQHLADPYTLTHVLHGMLFYALLRPLAGRLKAGTRLVLAVALEALWEVGENSAAVIQRYRQATMALGYTGDSILNSVGDIAACGVGFYLAGRLPVRWSIAFFLLVEAALLLIYRDNLGLNILMLIWPVKGVKSWQMGALP
jgi:hypothetical protein